MRSQGLLNYFMTVLLFFGILDLPYLAVAEPYKPGEILVKFTSGVSEAEIDAMVMSYGASILGYIAELNVYRLKIPSDHKVPEMVDFFGKDPRCEYAEPNFIGQGGDFVPEDTFFPQQWYLNNLGLTGGTIDADIDAEEGWQITTGSSSLMVAVLDTGIDPDHLEFQGRILPGFDFVNNDSDPAADHPHGILVSGILAANADNRFSIAGIDHHVNILPVKVLNALNQGTTIDLANGLIFAANQGAHVINMSLINYPTDSATLNDALQFARNAGAILIACAGNGGIGNADVSGPGASPVTISVGATDHNDARASFSGTGTALDVVAPGFNLPTVSFNSNLDDFSYFSGCSAATPVVSGIATLLLSINHLLTHDQIRKILIETAEDLVGPAAEDTPGRDDFFGHGRVNMNNALLFVEVPVPIDIKPGSFPNKIDPKSKGKIPVAILTTESTNHSNAFDAATVDPVTVRFGSTGIEAAPLRYTLKDVDGDADADLVLRFKIKATRLKCRDTFAVLTGETIHGQAIHGNDSIKTVGCKRR